jgi:hypothetical protein
MKLQPLAASVLNEQLRCACLTVCARLRQKWRAAYNRINLPPASSATGTDTWSTPLTCSKSASSLRSVGRQHDRIGISPQAVISFNRRFSGARGWSPSFRSRPIKSTFEHPCSAAAGRRNVLIQQSLARRNKQRRVPANARSNSESCKSYLSRRPVQQDALLDRHSLAQLTTLLNEANHIAFQQAP